MIRTALTIALLTLAPAAMAQEYCAGRDEIISYLIEGEFEETLQGMGMAAGNVMEIYANPETGTWTIIVTSPEGVTCPVGYGKSWQNVAPLEPQGDPA